MRGFLEEDEEEDDEEEDDGGGGDRVGLCFRDKALVVVVFAFVV